MVTKMARLLGVEGGRIYKNTGYFNPGVHNGVDVFTRPRSQVYVPVNWGITITSSYNPTRQWGQVQGWATICDRRYGFVAAHFDPIDKPATGQYRAGEFLGLVAGRVPFTPHIHWALNPNEIPPMGTVNPHSVWRHCVGLSQRRANEMLMEAPEDIVGCSL